MILQVPIPPCYNHSMIYPQPKKFHKKGITPDYTVTRTGCWEFTNIKAKTPSGYPLYRRQGKNYFYSHYSLEHFKGVKFGKGDYACHLCDNPKCVNPDHLYLGNEKTNKLDMIEHCRSTRGSKNPMSKFTEKDIGEIKRLCKTLSQTTVANMYGVRQPAISRIITGKRWGWLND